MLIGLTGFAQSGKDTVASILVEEYGFERVAFADKIRQFVYETNPLVDENTYLRNIVDAEGWEEAKQDLRIRRVLQAFGLGARKIFGDNHWIVEALKDIDHTKNYVITDVRFINEAEWLKGFYEAKIWRVVRPDVGPVNNHVSETQMNGYEVDKIIVNASTLEDLKSLVRDSLNVL